MFCQNLRMDLWRSGHNVWRSAIRVFSHLATLKSESTRGRLSRV